MLRLAIIDITLTSDIDRRTERQADRQRSQLTQRSHITSSGNNVANKKCDVPGIVDPDVIYEAVEVVGNDDVTALRDVVSTPGDDVVVAERDVISGYFLTSDVVTAGML